MRAAKKAARLLDHLFGSSEQRVRTYRQNHNRHAGVRLGSPWYH